MNLNETQLNADARRFFLGAMSDDERTAFETVFIAAEAAFDHVRTAEDELVEQYVRGTLRANENAAFEQHYLSVPANRERVAFTRAMIEKIASPRVLMATDEKISLWQSIAALFAGNRLAFGSAFALLAIIAAGWFIVSRNSTNEFAQNVPPVAETSPTPTTPTQTPQMPENNANAQTVAEANKPTPTPSPQNDNKPVEPRVTAPMLALFAGSVRGGGSMPQLDLPKTANGARLQLNLESRDYDRYSAEVVDPDGRVVARSENVRANGKRVEIFVPAARLISGEYTVRLSGVKNNTKESVADFPFRVTRK